jgi:hypothetical protein
MDGLVIRNQVSAVANDNKLETQMSLVVAGTLISQNPNAMWCLGPFLGATSIHSVQRYLTTLRISTQVAISILYRHLTNLGVVQKSPNALIHGSGLILLHIKLARLMVLLLLLQEYRCILAT